MDTEPIEVTDLIVDFGRDGIPEAGREGARNAALFRGADLERLTASHGGRGIEGFIHIDFQPSRLAGLLVALPGVFLESLLDQRIARELLTEHAAPGRLSLRRVLAGSRGGGGR